MGVHWGWLSCGVEVEVPGQGVLGDGKEEINSNSKVSSACAFDLGVQEGPSHGPSATRWSLAGSPEFSSSCPAASDWNPRNLPSLLSGGHLVLVVAVF